MLLTHSRDSHDTSEGTALPAHLSSNVRIQNKVNEKEIELLIRNGQESIGLAKIRSLVEDHRNSAKLHYQAACLLDRLGVEQAAVEYYQTAIGLGLPDSDLRAAYLGLGSTYRVLGKADLAVLVFDTALEKFPGARELRVFRCMALHNCGRDKEALEDLLKVVAETSHDPDIAMYERAIRLYAEDLDRKWI